MFKRNSAARASWHSPPSETKAQLSKDIFNLRRSLRGKERKKWAKIEADVVRHKCPVAEGLLEGLSHYRDDVNEIAASIEKLAASSASHHPRREVTRSPSQSPAIQNLPTSSAAHHPTREATRSLSRSPAASSAAYHPKQEVTRSPSPVVNGNMSRSPNRSGYNSEPRQQQESLTRYIARKTIVQNGSSPCNRRKQNGTPQVSPVNVTTQNSLSRVQPQLDSQIPHPSISNIVVSSSPSSSRNNSSERSNSKKRRSLSPAKKSKKQQQQEENHIEIDLVHGCVNVISDGCQGQENGIQGDDLDKENKEIYKVHEESLMKESWFQPDMTRDDVEDMLQTQKVGSFLVRRSTTCTGFYALAVRVPKRKAGKAEVTGSSKNVGHYLVAQSIDGQTRLKGSTQQWPSLKAMVEYFCKDAHDMLPCTLRLPSKGLARKLSDCPVDKKKTKKKKVPTATLR